MLGFMGMPLTGGLIGKFYVFSAAYEAGWWWLDRGRRDRDGDLALLLPRRDPRALHARPAAGAAAGRRRRLAAARPAARRARSSLSVARHGRLVLLRAAADRPRPRRCGCRSAASSGRYGRKRGADTVARRQPSRSRAPAPRRSPGQATTAVIPIAGGGASAISGARTAAPSSTNGSASAVSTAMPRSCGSAARAVEHVAEAAEGGDRDDRDGGDEGVVGERMQRRRRRRSRRRGRASRRRGAWSCRRCSPPVRTVL